MVRRTRRSLSVVLSTASLAVILTVGVAPAAGAAGRVTGRVSRPDGGGAAGVTVVVEPIGATAITDRSGVFAFDAVPAGTYSLTFTLGASSLTESGVAVADGRTTRVEKSVDWPISYARTITVTAPSRRIERWVETPASVSVIDGERAAREAVHGQLPRLLEALPGVDSAQASVSEFNVSVRGLNSSLSRRVLTRIDGRDPSIPLLNSVAWISLRWDLDELSSIELLRGPSSALYGANAFAGVIDITSREPRDTLGSVVRLQGGQLDTAGFSAGHSGRLGKDWFYRVRGGYQVNEDYAQSRVDSVEYQPQLLPREAIAPPLDQMKGGFSEVRLDRYFVSGDQLTLETSWGDDHGQTLVTPTGRIQVTDGKRGFARLAYRCGGWRLRGSYDLIRVDTMQLASGLDTANDSDRVQLELVRPFANASDRIHLVAGASYRGQKVDTANDQGRETILRDPVRTDEGALFGDVGFQVLQGLKLVAAGRVDWSDLHGPEISPKAGAVYSLTPSQTVRLTLSRAFQAPSVVERYLRVSAAPPLDLSGLEGALAPVLGGVRLGLESIPVRAVGNANLDVEKIRGLELGYSALLGQQALLSVDLYRDRVKDFISNLLPQVGTSLGRINPSFGPYRPPAELSPEQAAIVLDRLRAALPPPAFAQLSNDLDGSPMVVVVSYTNIGEVDTTGVDLGLRYFVDRHWSIQGSYSWLDFDARQNPPESPVVPNAPAHKLGLEIAYAGHRLDMSLRARWVDAHTWTAGAFRGPIPSYTVVDLRASCGVTRNVTAGLDVRNLLDDRHWEVFGGDILRRRALASVTVNW